MAPPRRSARIIESRPPPSAAITSRSLQSTTSAPGKEEKPRQDPRLLNRQVTKVDLDQAIAKIKREQNKVDRLQTERDNMWPSIKAHEAAMREHQQVIIQSQNNLTKRNKETDKCEEHEAQLDDKLNKMWDLQKDIDHTAGVIVKLLDDLYKIEAELA